MLGYIFAVLSSLFFSFYVVPRKLSKLPAIIFSFYMALGFSISSCVLYLFQPLIQFHEKLSIVLLWSFLAGIIWATAFVLFITSIDLIGLSRSNQWKNLQGPVGVILSLIILGEFAKINPLYAIIAAIVIFISALLFTAPSSDGKRIDYKGVGFALLSALGFGSVAVIQKYVTTNVGIYSQQVVWSISILMSLFTFITATNKFRQLKVDGGERLLGLGAGLLYLGASLLQLFSFRYISASISFTIIQMNALWTVGIGIFIFNEIDIKKYYKRIILGVLFTLCGIFLLVVAKK